MNPIKEGVIVGVAVMGIFGGYIGGIYLGEKVCKATTRGVAKFKAWKASKNEDVVFTTAGEAKSGDHIAADDTRGDNAKDVSNVVELHPA